MDRLLARLERRIGRLAIPNLIFYIVGGMAVVWLLGQMPSDGRAGEILERLPLVWPAVMHGEAWRLVTFLVIPPPWSMLWVLVGLYFAWWVGSSLEQHWGSFRFNVYYFTGAIGAIAAAAVVGAGTNVYLNASLFLAFATLFPDVVVLLMFILPIRVKWLGMASGAMLAYQLVTGGTGDRISIAAAMINYLLFFGGHWMGVLRSRNIQVRQQAKREQFKGNDPVFGHRVCAICGKREADGTDIRVCSCDKCATQGAPSRTLCLEHARNH
jgi:membrane associated rhomboid family serine protease